MEEDQHIEKWLEENSIADPAWQHLDRPYKDKWLSDVFVDIKASVQENESKTLPRRSENYLWHKIAGVAAALILVFSLYITWPVLKRQTLSQDLTLISTPAIQKKQVTLADGTTVWLNAGSELKYPKVFNEKTRVVYLSGEAYFDVKHEASRAFVIHTGKILTTVLGTAFNIKENQTRHTIQVTVTRGKVSVADDGKLLSILTPNQQVSIDLLTGNFTKTTTNANAVIAWQNDEMQFDDITLADAAMQLEQRFQVKITFDHDQLKNCRFSGSTLKGDSLDKILDVISGFNNATWKKQSDGHIVIYGAGCN